MDSGEIIDKFGGKLRVRVNGILIERDNILMVKHKFIGPQGHFWSVPGGGMNYGESVKESLQREFREETGLDIEVCEFLFTHEFLEVPLHAIELFFIVKKVRGDLIKGMDPEMKDNQQIIIDVKFMNWDQINTIENAEKHQIFQHCQSLSDLRKLNGYLDF